MGDAAVLVVDMQNAFCHEDGTLVRAGIRLEGLSSVVEANAALVARARFLGVPVWYTRHVFRPGLADMPERFRRAVPLDPPPLVRGSWDADIIDELTPRPGEKVIDKNRFDAFLYTDLEPMLRSAGVGRLLVTGVITDVCVESTVRSAEQRGFQVSVASDCTAGRAGGGSGSSLAVIARVFATVGEGLELLEGIAGSPAD